MKNEGKIFEQSFENSIDKSKILVKRFNDNAASFGQSSFTRFTSTNECDYELFDTDSRTLYFLELKTTLSSLTYWREDFDKDNKAKKSYQIKKNQILGLEKFQKYSGTICGFIINFRAKENNPTYFIPINNFIQYTSNLEKKSINISDVQKMNPIQINNQIKRTRFTYDIENFINQTTGGICYENFNK